jgi:hypothetical protein
LTRRLGLLIAANFAVVGALVIGTLMVHHDRETILYGDVFAIVALLLADFLLVKVSDTRGV